MTECLLSGRRCFLEQPAWQEVMQSIVVDSSPLSDRSEIVISLLRLKSCIPGFAVDVTNMVCMIPGPDFRFVEDVICRIRSLRSNFLNWYRRYQSILSQCTEFYPGSSEYDNHCKVFANYLSCMIISSRLLAAISPTDRIEVERVTQGLASRMLELEKEVQFASSQTICFMSQTLVVARATLATESDWKVKGETDGQDHVSSRGLIERWKLEKWCKIFGRRVP